MFYFKIRPRQWCRIFWSALIYNQLGHKNNCSDSFVRQLQQELVGMRTSTSCLYSPCPGEIVEEPGTDTESIQQQITPRGSPGKRPAPSSSSMAHIRLAASSGTGGAVSRHDESFQEGVSTSVLEESARPSASKKVKPSPIVWKQNSNAPCESSFWKWLFSLYSIGVKWL